MSYHYQTHYHTNDGSLDVKVFGVKICFHLLIELSYIRIVVVMCACEEGVNTKEIAVNAFILFFMGKAFDNVDKVEIAIILLVVLSVLNKHKAGGKSISSHFAHHNLLIS